ncbi:carcinoembryonic antigen-related cell adhesion molecule 5-like [Sus scrofa]|uniref:carcinoembryonic antigen-related cell adhesion molecule 5-like n=1 Tax=Sus scrofa TaxID=9823 RepID=UPI000A2B3ECA|nr:carcinoembryonic antigen-related cell adhesion molecule 5-like [Sus scrofa]
MWNPSACTASPQGVQWPSLRWYVNGQSIFPGGHMELSSDHRMLTLHNISRNDTGHYQCESRNSAASSISDPVLVKVICRFSADGPDLPVVNPPDPEVRAGAALTLSCFADSNPPAQYRWEVDGKPGPATQHLVIAEVSLDQEGRYTCKASNSITHLCRSANGKIWISGGCGGVMVTVAQALLPLYRWRWGLCQPYTYLRKAARSLPQNSMAQDSEPVL